MRIPNVKSTAVMRLKKRTSAENLHKEKVTDQKRTLYRCV